MTTPAAIHQQNDGLTKVMRVMIIGFFTLFPLFFLPFTQNYYEFNKWILLILTTLAVTLLWSLRSLKNCSFIISWSSPISALLILMLAGLVSLLFGSPNKIEGLTMPLGLVTFACLFVILFLGSGIFDKSSKNLLRWGLLTTVGILSLVSVYITIGLGKFMFPGLAFLADPLWTPVGSSIALVSLIVITLPLLWSQFKNGLKQKNELEIIASTIIFLVSAIALVLTLINLVPRYRELTLLPYEGWQIMLEAFKNPKTLLFGFGVENFMAAFTSARPISLNSTLVWNARFAGSASLLFQIGTTIGVIGVIGVIGLIRGLWPKKILSPLGLSIIFAILTLILLPPSFTVLIFVVGLFFLAEEENFKIISWRVSKQLLFIPYFIILLVLAIIGISAFLIYRLYAGEVVFLKSLDARQKNDGKLTYELQARAIRTNPYTSKYHFQFSRTNLDIANFIANNPTGTATNSAQKVTSEEDRKNFSIYLQQAVNEAKLAIKYSPQDVYTWENLAQIYQAVTGITTNARQFAITSYQQAIQLDPSNPLLRINLGGRYLEMQNFDSAIEQFSLSTKLKPDYANAYFNLAYAYQQRKNFLLAAFALKKTLLLVPAGSDDYNKTNKLLEDTKTYLTPEELNILNQDQNGSALNNQNELPLFSEPTPTQTPSPTPSKP